MAAGGGPLLTQAKTHQYFQQYISDLKLPNSVNLVFSEKAIAPAAVTHNEQSKISRMTLSLPLSYT